MVAKKTSKKSPKAKAKVKAEVKDNGLKTEVVDLDKKLQDARELSGFGIQAFMRDAIKNATRKNK